MFHVTVSRCQLQPPSLPLVALLGFTPYPYSSLKVYLSTQPAAYGFFVVVQYLSSRQQVKFQRLDGCHSGRRVLTINAVYPLFLMMKQPVISHPPSTCPSSIFQIQDKTANFPDAFYVYPLSALRRRSNLECPINIANHKSVIIIVV